MFDWDTEDDLDGLIYPYTVVQPELSAKFPGVILEEDTPVPVSTMDIETLDPNDIAASAADNSGITNTTGGV